MHGDTIMGKGKGSGVTPGRVQELLSEAVKAESQYAVAKKSGLALSVIQGILKGGREPTTGTLTKLSSYFGVPVHELRGEAIPAPDRFANLSEENKLLLQRAIELISDQDTGALYADIMRHLIDISDKDQLVRVRDLLVSEGSSGHQES